MKTTNTLCLLTGRGVKETRQATAPLSCFEVRRTNYGVKLVSQFLVFQDLGIDWSDLDCCGGLGLSVSVKSTPTTEYTREYSLARCRWSKKHAFTPVWGTHSVLAGGTASSVLWGCCFVDFKPFLTIDPIIAGKAE